jgi:hypothetical protein
MLGQDSWDRKPEQDSWNQTTREDSWDSKYNQDRKERNRTTEMGLSRRVGHDNTVGTRRLRHDNGTEHPGQISLGSQSDKSARKGQKG